MHRCSERYTAVRDLACSSRSSPPQRLSSLDSVGVVASSDCAPSLVTVQQSSRLASTLVGHCGVVNCDEASAVKRECHRLFVLETHSRVSLRGFLSF